MAELSYELEIKLAKFDKQLGATLNDFDKKATSKSKSTGLSMGKLIGAGAIAGLVTSGVTKAISGVVSLGKEAINVTAGYEAQMKAVEALVGGMSPAMEEAKKLARELGGSTEFSASEAGSAIEMLIKNGRTLEEVNSGLLQSTLSLASATGTDMATAADIATDAMSIFNKKASEMEGVVNGIAGTTIASKFDINDYAYALANGGGVAASAGISFEKFNAVIAATSSRFSSGMTAGTAYKTFLTRLSPSTKGQIALMDELGLSFFDANGKMDDQAVIADKLKNAFKGLSEEQRINYAKTLFGTEGMQMANAMIEGGGEAIRKAEEAIAKTNATEIAQKRLEGYAGQMKILKSTYEEFLLTIGDTGILTLGTTALASFTGGLSHLTKILGALMSGNRTDVATLLGITDPTQLLWFNLFLDTLSQQFTNIKLNAELLYQAILPYIPTLTQIAGFLAGFLIVGIVETVNWILILTRTIINTQTTISNFNVSVGQNIGNVINWFYNLKTMGINYIAELTSNGLAVFNNGLTNFVTNPLGSATAKFQELLSKAKETINWLKSNPIKLPNMEGITSGFSDLKSKAGFKTGGYTGGGDSNTIAGLVHKNEYVLNTDNLNKMGGVNGVESLIRFFSGKTGQTNNNTTNNNSKVLNNYGNSTTPLSASLAF